MDIEKAIEHLKSDLIYAKKNNFKPSAINLKLEIINSIIGFYNSSQKEKNELEFEHEERLYKQLKLEMMLVIIGIDYDDIKRNLKKPLLHFLNLFQLINKNKNGLVGNKRFFDFYIKSDIENQEYQTEKLMNQLKQKNERN